MTGTFKDIYNSTISVTIGDNSNIVIGGSDVKFASSPLFIDYEMDDEFQTIIKKTATINLVSKIYLGDYLYTTNARDIPVTIYKGGTLLFEGFVLPLSFNQEFHNNWDEFTIQCGDYLTTLQYYNYKDSNSTNYDQLKETANIVTFKDVINTTLGNERPIFYDNSKGSLANYSVHELNFYDDDLDSVWNNEDVLNQVLKYLNLHVIRDYSRVYIFDWNTIKEGVVMAWKNINSNSTFTRSVYTVPLQNNFADSTTNISVDDVYNQIQVNCKFNSVKELFESPLDKDSLVSKFSGKQKFMTEYISEGEGDHAYNAFRNLISGTPTNYKEAKTVDWFMQVMSNPNWKLYTSSSTTIDNTFEQNASGVYINQWKVGQYLKNNQIMPAIIRMAKNESKGGTVADNSPIAKLDTQDYLFISVNGNKNNTEANHSPTDATLENRSPLIEYVGTNNGGVFSPADDNVTNYLVFSGTLAMLPPQEESGTWANRNSITKYMTVPSENNDDGRYYTRKWYTTVLPNDAPSSILNGLSLHPFTQDKGNHMFEYNYSANGNGTDTFSKLPILECELIIGNKRLIETNMDENGNSTFQWVTVGSEPTQSYVDNDGMTKTYTVKTFSLGVNPKIGDKILGTEFQLQNTIHYNMNIDATGTAIPIKKSDQISGKVTFRIVGLINSLWNQITRRHPTFFRHTKWYNDSKFILANTENIIIKNFECKLLSDNGMNENDGQNEFVYQSAENLDFTNKNEQEFKLVTQLSSSEAISKGATTAIALNAVLDSSTKIPILGFTYKDEFAKAEEHYINYYYNTYSVPKLIIECNLKNYNVFNTLYYWNMFPNKVFIAINKSIDLKNNHATLKLKEI